MGLTDWIITGAGGQAIIDVGGSKRCRLSGVKEMLWHGNSALANSEIIADIYMGVSFDTRGGLVLRSNSSLLTCYKLLIYGARTYYVTKIVSGLATVLTTVSSGRPWNEYTKTRFRVDGYQLSVEEYYSGVWNLVTTIIDTEFSIASFFFPPRASHQKTS